MKRTIKTLALLGVAGATQAMTFNIISVTGTGSAGWNCAPFGSNGYEFSLPDDFIVGQSLTRFVDIHFQVTATAGFAIDHVYVSPVGSVRNGDISIVAKHYAGPQTYSSYDAAGGSIVGASGGDMPFAPIDSFFDVFVSIDLSTTNASNPTPYSKVTDITFQYTESLVPEPAALATLGLGISALFIRNRKRR
ncbi:MAG: PEP-CTERM sorting domain-containing protein [Armatimonadetes bacterium]|nr:PEP-CTERM sorting domain-containing protein [Armatimonadota bacterium]